MFLAGCVGVTLQAGLKINAINLRTPDTVGFGEILRKFIRMEFARIMISVVSIILVLFGVDGYLNLRSSGQTLDIPGVGHEMEMKIIYMLNFMVGLWGYFSNSLILFFTNKVERFLNPALPARPGDPIKPIDETTDNSVNQ